MLKGSQDLSWGGVQVVERLSPAGCHHQPCSPATPVPAPSAANCRPPAPGSFGMAFHSAAPVGGHCLSFQEVPTCYLPSFTAHSPIHSFSFLFSQSSIHPSTQPNNQSTHPLAYPPIHPSIHLTIYPSIPHPPTHPSILLLTQPLIYLSIYSLTSLSNHPSIGLSVHPVIQSVNYSSTNSFILPHSQVLAGSTRILVIMVAAGGLREKVFWEFISYREREGKERVNWETMGSN